MVKGIIIACVVVAIGGAIVGWWMKHGDDYFD